MPKTESSPAGLLFGSLVFTEVPIVRQEKPGCISLFSICPGAGERLFLNFCTIWVKSNWLTYIINNNAPGPGVDRIVTY